MRFRFCKAIEMACATMSGGPFCAISFICMAVTCDDLKRNPKFGGYWLLPSISSRA